MRAADHVELFQVEGAEGDFGPEPFPAEQARRFEQYRDPARVVVRARRALDGIHMGAEDEEGRVAPAAGARDDVAVAPAAISERIALDREAERPELFLDIVFDRRQARRAREGAALADDIFQADFKVGDGCSRNGRGHQSASRTAMPLSKRNRLHSAMVYSL